jgi:hypothetical protein
VVEHHPVVNSLRISITSYSKIGIAHLWKEALSAILEELAMDYGYGTADDERDSGQIAGGWYVIRDLAPLGVGRLDYLVLDEEPPYSVLARLHWDIMTDKADYSAVLRRVGERFKSEYWVDYTLTQGEA